MNREKRKHRLQLKPYLDKLEMRRLMSVSQARPRLDRNLLHEQMLEARLGGTDLDTFALALAQHPRLAADLGLGALSRSLRQNVAYATQHGWAASLVSELTAHPHYTANHHLGALMVRPVPPVGAITPPAPPVGAITPPAQPIAPASTNPAAPVGGGGVQPVSPTPPSSPIPTPTPPGPILQDPVSIAIGETVDVTLPSLGLGSTGLTFTITPQPLPANKPR